MFVALADRTNKLCEQRGAFNRLGPQGDYSNLPATMGRNSIDVESGKPQSQTSNATDIQLYWLPHQHGNPSRYRATALNHPKIV